MALVLVGCGQDGPLPSSTDRGIETSVPDRRGEAEFLWNQSLTSTPTTLPPVPTAQIAVPLEDLSVAGSDTIHWYDWDPASFALAQAKNKPILLDLTAVWCHWCHVMDETTYSDPAVIRLVNSLYVPIRVDTDQRPDVQARYLLGGWPTTAFLTPEGDILTGGTYIPSEELIPMLEGVSKYYAANEADIAARVAELRQELATGRPQRAAIPLGAMQAALDRLETDYDRTYGGFSQPSKFPFPAGIELIFRHDYTAADSVWRERALHTLAGMQNLVDPVWGGVYRYSVSADWQTPHYEKLLSGNAEALLSYLEAYQVTGETDYRTTAEAILEYVERFLWDPKGGFYGSQDADLVHSGGHEIMMAGEDYFPLAEEERLALGVPYVDPSLYTNWNGQMIAAMLEAVALLEEPRYREMALQALDRLWELGRGPDGGMRHSVRLDPAGNPVSHPPATLSDQVHFGLALLVAYSVTGQRAYLARAQALADYVLAELRDPESGGLYDLPADPAAPGTLGIRGTPCPDNVVAARFFTRLYWMTAQGTYRDAAEGALKLCAYHLHGSPDYALAADDWRIYPLTLAVVGTPGEGQTNALLAAANRHYAPGKVVIPLDPTQGLPTLGEFTYPPEPAAIYACRERLCSLPATDPSELPDRVEWLMAAEAGQGEKP